MAGGGVSSNCRLSIIHTTQPWNVSFRVERSSFRRDFIYKSHIPNLTVIYIPYSNSFHKCQTAPETNNYQGDLVLQSKPDLLNGADLNLNSFVTHTFQVREMPGKVSGVCSGENQDCRAGLFTVNSHENQGKCCFDCCCFWFCRIVGTC